jgi:hypothetical protein
MTDKVDNQTDQEALPIKRGRGRPRKLDSTDVLTEKRPDRIPIHKSRDVLSVEGKNPHYEYRWVLDRDETGQRIHKFLNAGYDFADKETDKLKVGDSMVFKSEGLGNIYRVPAGGSQYLYLMRIRKDWFESDQAAKQREIDELEQTMIDREVNEEGRYGSLTIT